ncbi:MAG: hypothetical protein ACRD12_04210 [Acidimicrobiales bacterium]
MTDTTQWSPPPPAAEAAMPEPPPPTKGKKAKREKPPKAPRAPRPGRSEGPTSLFDMSNAGPSKDELDRMAAAELGAAIAPSLDLLQMSVPGASSPGEAGQQIEGKLGPSVADRDAGIPSHPIYTGDALVYYQLRRHYGKPHAGGSFQRSWYPGGGSGGGGATGALPPMLGS